MPVQITCNYTQRTLNGNSFTPHVTLLQVVLGHACKHETWQIWAETGQFFRIARSKEGILKVARPSKPVQMAKWAGL